MSSIFDGEDLAISYYTINSGIKAFLEQGDEPTHIYIKVYKGRKDLIIDFMSYSISELENGKLEKGTLKLFGLPIIIEKVKSIKHEAVYIIKLEPLIHDIGRGITWPNYATMLNTSSKQFSRRQIA